MANAGVGARQIFMYEDLKSDYINPVDFASKLNSVRVPSLFAPRSPVPAPLPAYTRARARARARVAQFVLYEYVGQAGLALVFLVSLSWTAFLLNVPLLAYHGWKYVRCSCPCPCCCSAARRTRTRKRLTEGARVRVRPVCAGSQTKNTCLTRPMSS
jgi:hypothetical protein